MSIGAVGWFSKIFVVMKTRQNLSPSTRLTLALALLVFCAFRPPPAQAWQASLLFRSVPLTTGYNVYVRRYGEPYGPSLSVGAPVPGPSNLVSYVVGGLELGPTFYFKISSIDSVGAESATSNEISITYAEIARGIDSDGDGLTDAEEDVNLNGIVDPGETDPMRSDSDNDGLSDHYEVTVLGSDPLSGDSDNDGVGDALDNCPLRANLNQADDDGDVFGNVCDNCSNEFNPDQMNTDGVGRGDVCDACATDPGDLCSLADSAGATIDFAGGSVVPSSGKIVLDVPGGALEFATSVAITEVLSSMPNPLPAILAVSDISPSWLELQQPALVTVSWQDSNNDGIVDGTSPAVDERDLKLWLDDNGLSGDCSDAVHRPGSCTDACCDTDQNTWAVQISSFGRLTLAASSCGNGLLDGFEECDDGNLLSGDCCSATCSFEPAGASCDDDDVCTTGDACDGEGACTVGFFRDISRTKVRAAIRPGDGNDVLIVTTKFPIGESPSPPNVTGLIVEVLNSQFSMIFDAEIPAGLFVNVKNKGKKYKFSDRRREVGVANGIAKATVTRDNGSGMSKLKVVMRGTELHRSVLDGDLTNNTRFGSIDVGVCITAPRMECRTKSGRKVERIRCDN